MQRRSVFFPIFVVFLVLSLLIFFLAQRGLSQGVTGFFELATVPLQRVTFGIFHANNKQSPEEKLRAENAELLTQLAKQKELERENKALHDQFEVSNPSPKKLLPAQIIGMSADQIIIDKGTTDTVKPGSIVVYKDNLIGKVVEVSTHLSVVQLVTHKGNLFTAKTAGGEIIGVVKGQGESLIFDNVVLSDKLEKTMIVVTKGDRDTKDGGYPPGLVVGKIVSVTKKASSLFQAGEVKSLIDVTKLRMVFILKTI